MAFIGLPMCSVRRRKPVCRNQRVVIACKVVRKDVDGAQQRVNAWRQGLNIFQECTNARYVTRPVCFLSQRDCHKRLLWECSSGSALL